MVNVYSQTCTPQGTEVAGILEPMTFTLIQTLTLAGLALFVGEGLRQAVPRLAQFNLPAPVLGGLLVAGLVLAFPSFGLARPTFDTTLQPPLLIAFFTSLGFAASGRLLRAGGWQVLGFLALAAGFALLQGLLGIGVAVAFGLPPLFGVLTGTATLAGGPATALAFAPAFEQAGVHGAASIGIATAMAGIVLGGLVGGPVAGRIIARLSRNTPRPTSSTTGMASQASALLPAFTRSPGQAPAPEVMPQNRQVSHAGARALPAVVVMLAVMWLGESVSAGIHAVGVTLPAYVGAMLVAAAVRGLDDAWGGGRLPLVTIDIVGNAALALFLSMALMTLDLRQLLGLAAPLMVNLTLQVALVVAAAYWVVPRLMGRDYDAAVMAGGFTGFMLGTTANAMAVMGALVTRYGPAPRAYLVAPLVGAFFIDFTNALLITCFINWL